jgi:hypothetical protein
MFKYDLARRFNGTSLDLQEFASDHLWTPNGPLLLRPAFERRWNRVYVERLTDLAHYAATAWGGDVTVPAITIRETFAGYRSTLGVEADALDAPVLDALDAICDEVVNDEEFGYTDQRKNRGVLFAISEGVDELLKLEALRCGVDIDESRDEMRAGFAAIDSRIAAVKNTECACVDGWCFGEHTLDGCNWVVLVDDDLVRCECKRRAVVAPVVYRQRIRTTMKAALSLHGV